MNKRELVLGLLWDVGLPAVAFYVCRALGLDVLLSLTVGGLVAVLRVVWVAATRRRLDGLAAVVAGTFVLLLVVSLITGDPRVLLAKESILTGSIGLLLLGSCVVGKPVLYPLIRRFFAGKPETAARLDLRWHTQPGFRRHFTLLSAVIGGVLLAEAIVRVVLIFLLPADVMAGVSTALHLGTLGGLVAWLLWFRGRRQQAAAREVAHAR